jgi:carbamoyltransferase
MTILGISAFYHDSAACIVIDGRIMAAAQEERFTRVKQDQSFPYNAIMFCLDFCKLPATAIDAVVFYEKPLIKLERILETATDIAPLGIGPFARNMPSWFTEKLRLEKILKREIGYRGPLHYVEHHLAHAASAFFPSPFEKAAIITVDGVGEWTTNSIATGNGKLVELKKEIKFPHSLGMLYSAFTEFLGFKVNSDEYKVMGLAPYGEPSFVDRILDQIVTVAPDGSYTLNLDYFSFRSGKKTAGKGFEQLFGCPPRKPESTLVPLHMDVARSIQAVTELIMTRQARYAFELTGMTNLCLAGGVALNCVANGKILKDGPFDNIWVQPAAGDAGGAVGAALAIWHQMSPEPRVPEREDAMRGSLLGPEFTDQQILSALQNAGLTIENCADDIHNRIAAGLADGQVVARFDGRMEYGPRALGARSILADARSTQMQRKVNEKVKFREGFRPFAPAVLEEECGNWFESGRSSPYMLMVSNVSAGRMKPAPASEPSGLDRLKIVRSEIPAVTHVDGSARIQTVSKERFPDFRKIIESFHALTGCPVVLNTSFNLRGEPIVCTPDDAVRTFLASDIDALAVGPYFATKPAGWTRTALPKPLPFRRPRRKGELRRFGIETCILFGLFGLAAFFIPDNPKSLLSYAMWTVSAVALAFGLLAPERLRAFENLLNHAGAHMNSGVGLLLFGAVHILVVTPTGLIRKMFHRDGKAPRWTDAPGPDERGTSSDMY